MFEPRQRPSIFGPRRSFPPGSGQRGRGLSPRNRHLPGQSGKFGQFQQSAHHVKSMFQDEDGDWDYGKLMTTADQLQQVYKNVSPLISDIGGVIKKIK